MPLAEPESRSAHSRLDDLQNGVPPASRRRSIICKKCTPQSVTAVFNGLSALADSACAGKPLDVCCTLHDISVDALLLDELRFKQICMNLLSNAVKYTPAGGHIVLEMYEIATAA